MSSNLIQTNCSTVLSNSPIISCSTYETGKFIASSSYLDHLLDLTTLDAASKELALLLQELKPNEGHLDKPFCEAFNWSTTFSKISHNFSSKEFYIVAFRSHLARLPIHSELIVKLHAQDKACHFEANESGGLLKYWFSDPDSNGRNLSACVWTDPDSALKASKLPQHGKAIEIIRSGVYEAWTVERYKLNVECGGKWTIETMQ